MGGIAGITSLPEVRRKGIIRTILIHYFEFMFTNQVPVSSLYPFKESFYEKLGYSNQLTLNIRYVVMPCPKQYVFNHKSLAFLTKLGMNTKIIRTELTQETLKDVYDFFEKYQTIHHGTITSLGK